VVLVKSYQEYMDGFADIVSGEARRGFKAVAAASQDKDTHQMPLCERGWVSLVPGSATPAKAGLHELLDWLRLGGIGQSLLWWGLW